MYVRKKEVVWLVLAIAVILWVIPTYFYLLLTPTGNQVTGAAVGLEIENNTVNDSLSLENNIGKDPSSIEELLVEIQPALVNASDFLINEQNQNFSSQQVTTQPDACGTLSTSLTLVNSVSGTGTCFTIGASGITLDCAGFSVTYGTSGVGAGIENNGNYDNVVIKNCLILKGATGGTANNHGINITGGAFNNSIVNNTIVTGGTTDNYGIFVRDSSNNTVIENNTIYTNGSSSSNIGINIHRSTAYSRISNNIIITNGTGTSYGIYLFNGTNHSMITNNNISTRGTGSTDNGIRIEDVSANNSLSGNTIYTWGTINNFGIYLLTLADRNIIENNSIYSNGSSSGNVGIRLQTAVLYSQITGNTIVANGTVNNYGIYLITRINHSLIKDNNVSSHGTSSGNVGIRIESLSNNNSVAGNIIYTYGTSANEGILALTNVERNIIENNSIHTNGSTNFNYGIRLRTAILYYQIVGNTITTNGTDNNYGIYLQLGSNHSLITGNKITASGSTTDNSALVIESESSNNTFLNNNFSVTDPFPTWVILDTTITEINNSLIYNNTFGEIRWNNNGSLSFLSNLTLNISNDKGLGLDLNLFIGNNTIAFNSSAFLPLRINGSVNLTLAGLNFTDIIGISKIHNYTTNASIIYRAGFYCNPDSCNISNYTTDGGILTFNSTGLSSYAANLSEPDESVAAPTAASSTSSAGSGAGGGGGGSTSRRKSVTSVFASYSVARLEANSKTNFAVDDPELAVTNIEFTVEKEVYGAKIAVEKLSQLPSINLFPGAIYQMMQISQLNLEGQIVGNYRIYFDLPITWLEAKGLSKEQVKLYLYTGYEWEEQLTLFGETDGAVIHFTAETPHFSYFAIGVKETVAETYLEPRLEQPAGELEPELTEKSTPLLQKPTGMNEVTLLLGMVMATILVAAVISLVKHLRRSRRLIQSKKLNKRKKRSQSQQNLYK